MTDNLTYKKVNDDILKTLRRPGLSYFLVLFMILAVLFWGIGAWAYQIYLGIGVAGISHPVMWGVYIATFVFWIGIAHSGTLISAVLYLFRARWRRAIYRSSEAMTVFAVITAGLFPIIHLGRPWYFYWIIPYPNQRELWINFKSPLVWDFFAIGTYLTVSSIFLYIGMIPDIAVIRENTKGIRRFFYNILSLGWRGTDREWHNFNRAYMFFAAFATPLVVSVHSVVSWDFAMTIVPGWHSTIFAPYFVAGAIFSGLAMVITLVVPLRRIFHLEDYITTWHFDSMGKLIIVTSIIVTYAYLNEFFMGWYSLNPFEREIYIYRATGPYAPFFWVMTFCNCIVPLTLFFKKIRTNITPIFIVSILVNIGMWLERFVIVVTSLAHEYEPFAWGLYRPSWVELSIIAGSFAWFFTWFFLFVKLFPSVSIAEVKEMIQPPIKRGKE